MFQNLTRLLYFLILLYFVSSVAEAKEVFNPDWESKTYRILKIIDGDTFVASDGNLKFMIRLAGVDALEKEQRQGQEAAELLRSLLEGMKVKLRPVGKEKYQRILAQVWAGKQDVGLRLVEEGLAVAYRPRCSPNPPKQRNLFTYPPSKKAEPAFDPAIYIRAEIQAQETQRGLWKQPSPELPCQFRKAHSQILTIVLD